MTRIFFLCFLIILSSCNEGVLDRKVNSIDINISAENDWIDISEMYNAEFIALETSKESRIGIIKKVLLHKNELYIFDIQQEKLLVFGLDGSFHRTIGKKGKGTGEILKLADFNISNDQIFINSLGNNKMLIFNLNGDLNNEVKFPDYIGMKFQVIKNGFISNAGGASNKAATFYTSGGKTKQVVLNETYKDLRYLPMNSYTICNGTTYMLFSNNDTIYKVDEDAQNLIPNLYVDFNGKNIPIHELKTNERLKNYKKKNNYYQIWKFFYNSLTSYFLVTDDKKFCHVFYDLENNTYQYAERISYKDFQIIEVVGEYQDNGLIATWHPYMVPSYKKIEKKTFDFIPDTCLNANMNWNPGLVLLEPKEANLH